MELLKDWAAVDARWRKLNEELDACEKERKEMLPLVLSYFEEHGIASLKLEGRTFYLHSQLWAAKKDIKALPIDLLAALELADHHDYAPQRVDWQGLSALFRERERDGEDPVPEKLRSWFKAEERFSVRSRGS